MVRAAGRVVGAVLLGACSDPLARHPPRGRSSPAPPLRSESGPPPAPKATRSASDPVSLEILEKALRSPDYATRLIAVEAAGELPMPQAVEWLARALGDPEHDVRVAAVMGLGVQGARRAEELLRTVRDDETEQLDIRALASSALLTPTVASVGGSR